MTVPVALQVSDLDQSIRFYSQLFGSEPTYAALHYAEWMSRHTAVKFAICSRGVPQTTHKRFDVLRNAPLPERNLRKSRPTDNRVMTPDDLRCLSGLV